jgi:hypothetical protein
MATSPRAQVRTVSIASRGRLSFGCLSSSTEVRARRNQQPRAPVTCDPPCRAPLLLLTPSLRWRNALACSSGHTRRNGQHGLGSLPQERCLPLLATQQKVGTGITRMRFIGPCSSLSTEHPLNAVCRYIPTAVSLSMRNLRTVGNGRRGNAAWPGLRPDTRGGRRYKAPPVIHGCARQYSRRHLGYRRAPGRTA